MEASEEDRLPEVEIIDQMSYVSSALIDATLTIHVNNSRSLTFAGTDTTSNALARILHLLSMHPDVQERLRQEITDARSANDNHDLSYDELIELPYLDAVCRETMRLYVPSHLDTPMPFYSHHATGTHLFPSWTESTLRFVFNPALL